MASDTAFDRSRLEPANLKRLSEAEQGQLLAESKAEMARLQAKNTQAKQDLLTKLQRNIAHHEAQLTRFDAELQKIDEVLTARDPVDDTEDERHARAHLLLGRRFFRSARRKLEIQLKSLQADFGRVTGDASSLEESTGPFSTYDWRRAAAECDLALVEMLMHDFELGHRVLAAALGEVRFPDPSATGTSAVAKQATTRALNQTSSRSLTDSPAHVPKLGTSSLSLDDTLPPPADISASSDNATIATLRSDDLDPGEQDAVKELERLLADDATRLTRGKQIQEQLVETNGLLLQARAFMEQIETLPQRDGAALLDSALWTKLNGRLYALQRLAEQCADDPALALLFPKKELPPLPLEGREPHGEAAEASEN